MFFNMFFDEARSTGNLGPCDTGGRCWVQGWGTVLTTQSLFATDLGGHLGGHLDWDLKRKLMGMFDDFIETGVFFGSLSMMK